MVDCRRIFDDRDNRIAIGLILFISVITASLAILSEGTYGGADDISHYKIARHAFADRSLFFDLWGKPLFTMFSAPFTQFGFNGIRIFNVLVSAATCWFSYRTARKLGLSFSWSVVILTAFAPLYFVMSYTGMTEILFAFLVIFSIWLFASNKTMAAVIVLSFLPFARNEGFILWAPFIVAMVLRSRVKLIPLFAVGTIFFSILGALFFRDLLWIVHRFPYRGAADIYGSGSLFLFVVSLPQTAGIPLLTLSLAGLVSVFRRGTTNTDNNRSFFFTWYIILPALMYISAHSFVWWRGMGSSAGLVRVMAGILPLVSLVGALGIDYLVNEVLKPGLTLKAVVVTILLVMAAEGLTHYHHPTGLNDEEKLMKESAYWIRSSPFTGRKVYYYNPFLVHFLGRDPYDESLSSEKIPNPDNPAEGVLPGEIIVWDSHFGPNEGALKESALSASKFYMPLTSFGGMAGENADQPRVAIYERLTDEGIPVASTERYLVYPADRQVHPDSIIIQFSTFEGRKDESIFLVHNMELYMMEGEIEFSPFFKIPVRQLPFSGSFILNARASILAEDSSGNDEILLVTSLDRKGKPYIYTTQDFNLQRSGENGFRCTLKMVVPEDAQPDDELSVYIWNRSQNSFYIDSFTISIMEASQDY